MNVFKGLGVQRPFSTYTSIWRQWKLVESRRVAQIPDYKVGDPRPLYLPKEKKKFPEYKYGEPTVFKQSAKGLYGGSFIQFGNTVSESKHKTRRNWLPNIVKKSLWSETLNRKIQIKMTAKVLKTISKEGGIDNYLIKDKAARIKELGPTGWKLRYRVLQKKEQKQAAKDFLNRKTVNDKNGKKQFIYYDGLVNGKHFKITHGYYSLSNFLFKLEQLEHKADGKMLSRSQFKDIYSNASIEDILNKLDEYKFDLTTVSLIE